MEMLRQGVAQGLSPEALEKLTGLLDRVQRRQAELEFAGALVAFQDACPVIPKSSTAKIVTGSGSGYEFKFADFEQIVETIRPHLTAQGLSFSFDASASGANLRCVCTLRHANGHSITSAFELPTENKSGATPQQKFGGALTYAKRTTLVSVLGLTLGDPDPENEMDPSTVTPEEAAMLRSMIAEVNADLGRFLKFFEAKSVEDIRRNRYAEAVRALERKRKEGRS